MSSAVEITQHIGFQWSKPTNCCSVSLSSQKLVYVVDHSDGKKNKITNLNLETQEKKKQAGVSWSLGSSVEISLQWETEEILDYFCINYPEIFQIILKSTKTTKLFYVK